MTQKFQAITQARGWVRRRKATAVRIAVLVGMAALAAWAVLK